MNRVDIIKVAATVLLVVLILVLVSRIDRAQDMEESRIVRDAIAAAARTCYAVEGAYPQELEYLREYYRLAYDEDRYEIQYEWIGSNLLPDIFVTEIGAD